MVIPAKLRATMNKLDSPRDHHLHGINQVHHSLWEKIKNISQSMRSYRYLSDKNGNSLKINRCLNEVFSKLSWFSLAVVFGRKLVTVITYMFSTFSV